MKADEIASKYGIDMAAFNAFVKDNNLPHTYDFRNNVCILDNNVESYVQMFKEEADTLAEARSEMSKILITSGFSFDGYRITKYSGYISGDDAVQIPRTGLFGGNNNGENLTNALVGIRRVALAELKQAAYDLGCNAVIGVDFDYLTLDPQTANIVGGTTYEPYVICVTANGNAVVIEKDDGFGSDNHSIDSGENQADMDELPDL